MGDRIPSPSVSIGLPVLNGEKSLRRALDSILAQDFDDFELIISDNASIDNTGPICEAYAARDRRIRYLRNSTNIGIGPNHNRVFEISRGRYFAWSAHDLEYMPGMLRRCLAAIHEAPPSAVVVYPLCELVDREGKAIVSDHLSIAKSDPRPHRRLQFTILRIGYVTQLYGLIASETLRMTRLIGSYPSSDHVLLAELAMLGEIREIPEALLRREMDLNRGTNIVRHSQKAWAAWIDPKTRGNFVQFPLGVRLAFEYFRSAWRLLPGSWGKLACLWVGPATQLRRALAEKIRHWRRKSAAADYSGGLGSAKPYREPAEADISSAMRAGGPAPPIESDATPNPARKISPEQSKPPGEWR